MEIYLFLKGTEIQVQGRLKGGAARQEDNDVISDLLLWDLYGKCGRNGETLPCCGIPSSHHLSLEVELKEVLTLTGLQFDIADSKTQGRAGVGNQLKPPSFAPSRRLGLVSG